MALLTANEEFALGIRIRAGDLAARNDLVERNQPYVVNRMRRYASVCTDPDLAQAGLVGLIEAADVFDPIKYPGKRFIQIASHYVHKEMTTYLYSRNLVRIPVCMRRPEGDPRKGLLRQRNRQWAVRCAAAATRGPIRFEISEIGDHEPASSMDADDTEEKVRAAMSRSRLTTRESDVMHSRFGLFGTTQQSRRLLAIKYCVSRQMVEKIEKIAISKIRKGLTVIS